MSTSTRRDFFQQSAIGAAGLALLRPFSRGDPSSVLAERARECLEQVLEVARGPGGLIISHSRFDTRRPLQEDDPDLSPYLHQVLDSVWGGEAPKPTVADWYYGENTAWSTGWFLWSQMIRYRVTREPDALALARKCFRDLNHIFELSWPIEPGLLGKPHGGRGGGTTSFDQSANPILLYSEFARDHGTPAEKESAHRNLLAHGAMYFRRNWVMNHHGNLDRVVDPAGTSTMKYLACLHEAYVVTGEPPYRAGVEKYLRQIIGSGQLPWPKRRYEINANVFYYSWLSQYWHQAGIAPDVDWMAHIATYWEGARKAMDEDGLILDGIYDTDSKVFTPTTEGWFETAPPSAGHHATPLRWWRSPTGYQGRVLYSLVTAILGLMVRRLKIDPDGHEYSRKILLRIGRDHLRQCWDDGRLPPEMRPFANLFASEYCGQWLIAYWMGREQGVW